MLKRTDVHLKLLKERNKNTSGEDLLNQVKEFLNQDSLQEIKVLEHLKSNKETINHLDIDVLDRDRIFHLNDIEKICINYRLRFLDSQYFKGDFPQEAIQEIKRIERHHSTTLQGFKIIAPSKMFVLKKADDPLLFCSMGNGYFYLIHKWGNDLHPLRKWMMWPFKSFENILFAIVLSSILATMLVPDGLFTKKQTQSQDIMVFFFMFKSIAAIVLFYGFALGKNFNTAIWQSRYDKAQ